MNLKKLNDYINNLKNDNFDEYNEFLSYKHFVEKRTPDLKDMYYEFLDGKHDKLNLELFYPDD